MSTKTTLKRIALVAVSALGVGLLSVVPSSAAVPTPTGAIFTPTTFKAKLSTDPTASPYNWTISQDAGPLNFVGFGATNNFQDPDLTAIRAVVTGGTLRTAGGASAVCVDTGGTPINSVAISSTYSAGSWSASTRGDGVTTGSTAVASATGNGTAITYTAANHNFVAGDVVTISGMTPVDFNLSNAVVATAVAGSFTVASTYVGASTGAGTAATKRTRLLGADVSADGLDDTQCDATNIAYDTTSSNAAAFFTVGTPTAGTIKVEIFADEIISGAATTTLLQTFTVVVGAGSASTTYGKTVVTNTAGTYDASGMFYSVNTAGTTAATFTASQVNNLGAALITSDSKAVTVSLTGNAGSLSNTVPGATFAAYPAGTWVNTPATSFGVYADGRSGKATLTVAVDGVTVATEDFTFYSTKVASLTAVGIFSIARNGGYTAGALNADDNADCDADGMPLATGSVSTLVGTLSCPGATNAPGVAVIAKDANGNVIPLNPATLSMSSSDATIVIPGFSSAFVDNGQGLYSAGWGYIHTTYASAAGSKSGAKANLTYSYTNTDGTTVSSNAVAVSLGGTPAKEVMTLDSASYQPGAPIVLTLTATDSSGNPVYDGKAIPSDLTATRALQGAALPTTGVYVGGKYSFKANKYFAPATVGDFSINATSYLGDAITVASKVVLDNATQASLDAAADAAAEAIDAANAATDAANLAAEAADAATVAAEEARDAADAATAAVEELAAQVATLMAALKAQITTLANTVAKIAKKVKA